MLTVLSKVEVAAAICIRPGPQNCCDVAVSQTWNVLAESWVQCNLQSWSKETDFNLRLSTDNRTSVQLQVLRYSNFTRTHAMMMQLKRLFTKLFGGSSQPLYAPSQVLTPHQQARK